jgi:hypothetical protein
MRSLGVILSFVHAVAPEKAPHGIRADVQGCLIKGRSQLVGSRNCFSGALRFKRTAMKGKGESK